MLINSTIPPVHPTYYAEISDPLHDTSLNYSDIASLSYTTDLKTLNSTIWMTSPFIADNTSKIHFGMIISPSEGYGYKTIVNWNSTSQSWELFTTQITSTGYERVVRWQSHYDRVNYGEHPSIDFFFDLRDIGSPNQFEIVFFTTSGRDEEILDATDPIFIPDAEFPISITPVKVRQGTTVTTELQIKSAIPFYSNASFYLDNTSSILDSIIIPDKLSLTPLGAGSSVIQIQPLPDAKINQTYSLPLIANVSIPAGFGIPTSATVPFSSDLTATVLQPLPNPQFVIPEKYLLPLYAIIPSFLIPSFAKALYDIRQRRNPKKEFGKIKKVYSLSDKSEEWKLQELKNLGVEVENYYINGKISDSHLEFLKERILKYEENLRELKKIPSSSDTKGNI